MWKKLLVYGLLLIGFEVAVENATGTSGVFGSVASGGGSLVNSLRGSKG